jgi:minor extracellular serine protease Vpr
MPNRTGRYSKYLAALVVCIMLATSFTQSFEVAQAQSTPPTVDVSNLAIPGTNSDVLADDLKKASGPVQVAVKLADPALAEANGPDSVVDGGKLSADQQKEYVRNLDSKKNQFMTQANLLGAKELARLNKAHNAVVVNIDSSNLVRLSQLAGVTSVRLVRNYELDLSETVAYIGAKAAQDSGITGAGVTVAVLDSGIDYTHKNLGGPGTLAAYEAAYGADYNDPKNTTLDGLFPTAKVVGGFDFVGEKWPTFGDRTEDPDPIDFEGHGTHVADIIAGKSADGTHKGVAPDAKLLAVKVCSAVSSSCNGVALLKGVEFSLDPNGDGSMDDAVDVINMSLGSSYGQKEDDLSEASSNAVKAGVVIVASAGNSADRPYIHGSPAQTPNVIAVAQTQVPSAKIYPLKINSPASIAGTYPNTATVDWAPITSAVTGDVAFIGRGCPAGSVPGQAGEDAYLTSPAGKVALIDRGGCSVSLKVDRAAKAGATAVLIGLVAPGDASSFSFGGGDTFVPTLVIIQSYANAIKANINAPVNVTLSPDITISAAGSMVGSSSRGPSFSYQAIKPDIGAPGASISAIAGSGDGEEAFGGTSGAAPMVAGSAALMLQKFPKRKPHEIKSLLMNYADTNVLINPATQPGVLAPITRIGGGEVRVNKALNSTFGAWDEQLKTGSLSFGYTTVEEAFSNQVRPLLIKNYSNERRTFTINSTFRYADDAASGAVTLTHPTSVTVEANGIRTIQVRMRIDGSKLPTWTLNGGTQGGNGALLQTVEFDGYIEVTSGSEKATVAWHVLPHKAAHTDIDYNSVKITGTRAPLNIWNTGNIAGRYDAFSLMAQSPKIPNSELPKPGDNFAIIDLKEVGVRQAGSAIQFGITTYGQRSHPAYPAGFEVQIDKDADGTLDYFIYQEELTGFGLTGQSVVYVLKAGATTANAFFFTDADLNSGNIILTAPLSALELTPTSKFKFNVVAYDNYFSGAVTDSVGDLTYTVGTPRYTLTGLPATVANDGIANKKPFFIEKVAGGDTASPSQLGMLLMYRDNPMGRESDAIVVK